MRAPPPRAAGVTEGGAETRGRRQMALVMDEVDGMSAGDRGGVADLIKTVHKSKVAPALRRPRTAMACSALAAAAVFLCL